MLLGLLDCRLWSLPPRTGFPTSNCDVEIAPPTHVFYGDPPTCSDMAAVRRLVIDVLKPHDPPLLAFTDQVAELQSVDGVTSSLIELDQEVQNIKLTFEGEDVDFSAIEEKVESLGGSVHSVDQVACGDHVVTDRRTLQDA